MPNIYLFFCAKMTKHNVNNFKIYYKKLLLKGLEKLIRINLKKNTEFSILFLWYIYSTFDATRLAKSSVLRAKGCFQEELQRDNYVILINIFCFLYFLFILYIYAIYGFLLLYFLILDNSI